MTHEVDADRNQTVTVRVPKTLAQWEPPPVYATPTVFREHPDLKWEDIRPPPRSGAKKT